MISSDCSSFEHQMSLFSPPFLRSLPLEICPITINDDRIGLFLGNKNTAAQSTPFYVRRQSSVDTYMQPFLTQMVAPRVPPVMEDTHEQDGV